MALVILRSLLAAITKLPRALGGVSRQCEDFSSFWKRWTPNIAT